MPISGIFWVLFGLWVVFAVRNYWSTAVGRQTGASGWGERLLLAAALLLLGLRVFGVVE